LFVTVTVKVTSSPALNSPTALGTSLLTSVLDTANSEASGIVIVTVAVEQLGNGVSSSHKVYVKVSVPVKFNGGVYVKVPFPLFTTVPPPTLTASKLVIVALSITVSFNNTFPVVTAVFAVVFAVSLFATGFPSSVTVTDKFAELEVAPSLSLTVYVKVAVPTYPETGINVTSPLTSTVQVPSPALTILESIAGVDGSRSTVEESIVPSISVSVLVTLKVTGTSSIVEVELSSATGASFTAITEIITSAVSVNAPSVKV
jgi:hypothetical protein